MKKLTLTVTASVFSLVLFAQTSAKTHSHTPRVYIVMRQGKLIEINNGRRKLVKKDIFLVNHSTIHPNGAIDAGSGESLQLRDGQYITMDGRIRNLKDMASR